MITAEPIRAGLLDPASSPIIGLVTETACRCLAPPAHPGEVHPAFGVADRGRSRIVWHLALFGGEDGPPPAPGRFVHVMVTRAAGRPTPLPEALRGHLAGRRLADRPE